MTSDGSNEAGVEARHTIPGLLPYYGIGIVATTIGIAVVILLNLFTPLDLVPRHIAGLRYLRNWNISDALKFALHFAVILSVAYGPLLAAMHLMLRPVARCLKYFETESFPPEAYLDQGRRRLLNLPFVFIPVSIGFWVAIPAGISAAAFLTGQVDGRTATVLALRASMIGLIASTISFHRIEFYSRKSLIPMFFPSGRLGDIKGVARISIDRRIRMLFRLGSVVPMAILIVTLLTLQWEVDSSAISAVEYGRGILVFSLVVGAYLFVAGGVMHRAVSRSITRPLGEIIRVLRAVSRGDFDQQARVVSNDEIGFTGDVINQMTVGLQERERMQRSLELAMAVQRRLLPAEDPRVPGLDISGQSVYCDETGGDYYDYLVFNQNGRRRLGIVVGDVAGHGIPSALLMATVRGFLRQRAALGGGLGQIVADVNRQLCRDAADSGAFMTLFILAPDPDSRRLEWVRAGHEPAICYDPASNRFQEFKGNGMALGVDETAVFEVSQLEALSEGTVVVLCTDGIFETRSPGGELFGRERLQALIRQHAGLTSRRLLGEVTSAVAAFRGPQEPEDDITLVVVKSGAQGTSSASGCN